MKKLYTLSALLIAAVSFGQSVVITSVVDGTLSSVACDATTGGTSNPKIVELYVSGTLNLDGYRVQVESNGGAVNWEGGGGGLYLNGTFTNEFIYLVNTPQDDPNTPENEAVMPIFNELYPNLTGDNVFIDSYAPSINGNDAIRIATYDAVGPDGNLIAVIDQFGNPGDVTGSDDYAAAWAYQDGYAKRVNNTAPNAGTFVNTSFTYSGINALDNATCTTFVDAVDLGSYEVTVGLDTEEIAGLKVYPNPLASGSLLNIASNNGIEKSVAIYDVLGKQVFAGATVNGAVNTTDLKAGIYIVKITEGTATATRKLIVQ